MNINTLEYIFPVIAGEDNGKETVLKNVLGTAFSIGGGFFLTCDHVLKYGEDYQEVRLLTTNLQREKYESIVLMGTTRHEDIDLAIMHVPHAKGIKSMTWQAPSTLPMLTEIHAAGYPHALDAFNKGSIQTRAFLGTINSSTVWPQLPLNPKVYELSFVAPRGLSGAPLCKANQIVGVVFGNRSIEMTVFSEKEINIEGNETTVYEKIESYRTGLAIQAEPILAIQSTLLECTIGEHLEKHSLLAT